MPRTAENADFSRQLQTRNDLADMANLKKAVAHTSLPFPDAWRLSADGCSEDVVDGSPEGFERSTTVG